MHKRDDRIDAAMQTLREDLLDIGSSRCEDRILPVLWSAQDAFEKVAPILVINECPGDVLDLFRASWGELKRLIRKIEERKEEE